MPPPDPAIYVAFPRVRPLTEGRRADYSAVRGKFPTRVRTPSNRRQALSYLDVRGSAASFALFLRAAEKVGGTSRNFA